MQRVQPRVAPQYLLLIAGLVWMIAGGNILRIGLPDFLHHWNQRIWCLLGAAAIFSLFMGRIFSRLVKKHHTRILGMGGEKVPVYWFFDRKSYFIMIFMISGGLLLRSSHVLPAIIIGVLYCGIGASLIGAGILFLIKFFATWVAKRKPDEKQLAGQETPSITESGRGDKELG